MYLVKGSHNHDWAKDEDESKALKLLTEGTWTVDYVLIPYGSVIVFDLLLRHAGDGLYPYPFVAVNKPGNKRNVIRTQGMSRLHVLVHYLYNFYNFCARITDMYSRIILNCSEQPCLLFAGDIQLSAGQFRRLGSVK